MLSLRHLLQKAARGNRPSVQGNQLNTDAWLGW